MPAPLCGPGATEKTGACRRHGTHPLRTAGPTLAAGDWGPRPILTRAGDGPERAQGWPPPPGRPEAPKNHPAATGDGFNPHGGRPAVPRRPGPLMPSIWAGGCRPRFSGGRRNRPTQTTAARGGPGRTPPAPATTRPPAAEARRGVAGGQSADCNAARIPFGPEDGHKAAARDTPRGDSPGPGRRGGPCGPAWRHGRRGGTAEAGAIVWPGVGRRCERKKREGPKPLPNFVTPPRGTRFAPVPRSSRPHIPHRPALRRPSSPEWPPERRHPGGPCIPLGATGPLA